MRSIVAPDDIPKVHKVTPSSCWTWSSRPRRARPTKAERNGEREIALWKRGVTL